jgi:hypothetical protein
MAGTLHNDSKLQKDMIKVAVIPDELTPSHVYDHNTVEKGVENYNCSDEVKLMSKKRLLREKVKQLRNLLQVIKYSTLNFISPQC